MKTIGLIGGMNWEDTAAYYRMINEEVMKRLGDHHAARISLYSIDYKMIEGSTQMPNLERLAEMMVDACLQVEKTGADLIILTTNVMHLVQEQLAARIKTPVLHIADAVGLFLQRRGYEQAGLLGSDITRMFEFYVPRIPSKYSIEILLPEREKQEVINSIILNEVNEGELDEISERFLGVEIEKFRTENAEGIVISCPELYTLLCNEDWDIPLFDASRIHAETAVAWALGIVE